MTAEPGRAFPDPISFYFQWCSQGLAVRRSPDRMDRYALAGSLQRSLQPFAESPPDTTPDGAAPDIIPFGVVANLLHRAGWCNLTLNFEPGPDLRLRVYFSVDDLRLSAAGGPLRVLLTRGESPLSDTPIKRGSYDSPPLPQGDYRFSIFQGETRLGVVEIRLEDGGL